MEATTFGGLNQLLESNLPIRKACQAVELCLEANRFAHLCSSVPLKPQRTTSSSHVLAHCCRDNYRGFFGQCFSQLLKQIFGYDGSSWLNQIAQVPEPRMSPPPADTYGRMPSCMQNVWGAQQGCVSPMQCWMCVPTSVPAQSDFTAMCGGRKRLFATCEPCCRRGRC